MRNTLCGFFGLSALVAILAVAVVLAGATDQANQGQGQGPPFKVACCIQGECGQKTPDHCSALGGTSLGARSCAHNPCVSGSTTTTSPAATTTTTSPAVTTTTTSPALTTPTTSPAATTTTTGPVATTTTTGPVATTTTIVTTTTAPVTTTTTLASCCGFSPKPSELNFTTGIGTGNCGTVQLSNGTVSKNLACSGLF